MSNTIISESYKEAYKSQYSESTEAWRATGAKQKAQNILEITAGQKYSTLLEIGAGDGNLLKILAHNNIALQYHALEISESGIKQIKAKNIENLVSVVLFDGYVLPYADKSVDLVVLSHVLEHVEHERILLREIARVAKLVVIEVPKDYRFGIHHKVKHFLAYGHINMYTPSSLKFLLAAEGFKINAELLRLYNIETFTFGKAGYFRWKSLLVYLFKSIMVALPIKYISEKFINTITLLIEPSKENTKIF